MTRYSRLMVVMIAAVILWSSQSSEWVRFDDDISQTSNEYSGQTKIPDRIGFRFETLINQLSHRNHPIRSESSDAHINSLSKLVNYSCLNISGIMLCQCLSIVILLARKYIPIKTCCSMLNAIATHPGCINEDIARCLQLTLRLWSQVINC